MDIATVVGLCLACCLIVGSIVLGGAPLTAFVNPPSIMVVVGGSFSAALICFPLKAMLGMPKVMLKVLLNKAEDFRSMVETIVSLAEVARRDGLLSLESKLEEVENPFIRMGVQMAVDGTRPEVIESILRTEMDAVATRHKNDKNINPDGVEEDKTTVEFSLGTFSITSQHPESQTSLRIDFQLFGTVLDKDKNDLEEIFERVQQRLRDRVIYEIRNSNLNDLTDPGLALIKRRILGKSNRLMGKPIIQSIVIPEFSFVEQ
jgi:hypothetical protein